MIKKQPRCLRLAKPKAITSLMGKIAYGGVGIVTAILVAIGIQNNAPICIVLGFAMLAMGLPLLFDGLDAEDCR